MPNGGIAGVFSNPNMLDVVGFDTVTPALMAEFVGR
jgi:hypothetical protein